MSAISEEQIHNPDSQLGVHISEEELQSPGGVLNDCDDSHEIVSPSITQVAGNALDGTNESGIMQAITLSTPGGNISIPILTHVVSYLS